MTADTPPKPKKPNTAARKKKLAKQLEGLDMAEKMVDELLSSGLGTLAGNSAQTFDKLAKELGSCYLTGPQTAFTRIALAVRTVQKDPAQADAAYAEALRLLVALRSTIKKGRVFLEGKLEAGDFSAEDSTLFEALGGVWKLEELNAIGSVRENAKLVQLSFDGEGWNHSPVVVRLLRQPALRPADILIAAHSYDADNRPLSTYDYRAIRFLHFTGVRR